MKNSKRLLALAVSAALAAPIAAHATNGMNLEGYGAITAGMGGTSMAYDHGTAAMMNNPATLTLGEDGNRLDIAIGHLGIDLSVDGPDGSGMSWDSEATGFDMPAMGWTRKSDGLVYGVGMFAQGGMGAEYNAGAMGTPGGAFSAPVAGGNINNLDGMISSWLTTNGLPAAMVSHNLVDFSNGSLTNVASDVAGAAMTLDEMSEVSVGRMVFPVALQVSDSLSLGGSIDFVWAGMDLKMAVPGDMMGDMMMGTKSAGTITGGLVNGMGGMMMPPTMFDTVFADVNAGTFQTYGPMITGLNYGYLDFADDSPYTGEAQGNGFAGKVGFTFKASPKLTIGGTYHSKTSMGDLSASGAKMSMSVLMTQIDTTGIPNGGNLVANTGAANIDMVGEVKVKDFQWPDTMALGVSFQATDNLMITGDVKRINWSNVMENFTVEYTADTIMMGGQDVTANFAGTGTDMTMSMKQEWEDQTVVQLGVAFNATDALTLRAGYNSASNPIPNERLSYLFPATVTTHYTLGAGYNISNASSVDFAVSLVPATEEEIDDTTATISHAQTNWQLMYSMKF